MGTHGGALGAGAAWATLEYPDADVRCITFGSPRVGNAIFKKAFNALVATSLRLTHGLDPVTMLPPSFMYKHVRGAVHLHGHQVRLRHRPWHHFLRPNIADHEVRR